MHEAKIKAHLPAYFVMVRGVSCVWNSKVGVGVDGVGVAWGRGEGVGDATLHSVIRPSCSGSHCTYNQQSPTCDTTCHRLWTLSPKNNRTRCLKPAANGSESSRAGRRQIDMPHLRAFALHNQPVRVTNQILVIDSASDA